MTIERPGLQNLAQIDPSDTALFTVVRAGKEFLVKKQKQSAHLLIYVAST